MENNSHNSNEDNQALALVKKTFFDGFLPVKEYSPKVTFMTTEEIYQFMLSAYPAPDLFAPADVAQWLTERGFLLIQARKTQYAWLLLPVSN